MKTYRYVVLLFLIFNFIEFKAQLFENSIVAHYSSDSINIINNKVEKVFDISGLNQDLIQTTISRRPTPHTDNYKINNFNSLYFDGTDDRLISNFNDELPQGYTIFVVMNSPEARAQSLFDGNISSNRALLYYRLPSLNFILNSGVSLYSSTVNGQFEFSVFEVQFNGTNSKCKMNMDIIANGQRINLF